MTNIKGGGTLYDRTKTHAGFSRFDDNLCPAGTGREKVLMGVTKGVRASFSFCASFIFAFNDILFAEFLLFAWLVYTIPR